MVKVGITGGIGSGKSIVCKIFASFGIPIYNADIRAKEIIVKDLHVQTALAERFGNEIFENGMLNRSLLAQIIFNDKKALEFVNSVVHPAIAHDYMNWVNNLSSSGYCIKEAALLFESGIYKELDYIVTVVCPEETRIKRVLQRDNLSRDQVKDRIKNQWNDEEKVKLSDYVIINDDKHSLIHQINKLHLIFLSE